MSIVRKWAVARAEHVDKDGIAWIAETRAGTGTWVIRTKDDEDLIGIMAEFDDERAGTLLALTPKQRETLQMSEATYVELEVQLRQDYERRQKTR